MKIPTAENTLDYLIPNAKTILTYAQYKNALDSIKISIKYYVKAALEAAADKAYAYINQGDSAYIEGNIWAEIDKDSILNSYPEENIK